MINRCRSIYPVLLDGVHHLLWHRIIDRIVLLNAPNEMLFDQHIGFCHHRNDAYHTTPHQLGEIADLNSAVSAFFHEKGKNQRLFFVNRHAFGDKHQRLAGFFVEYLPELQFNSQVDDLFDRSDQGLFRLLFIRKLVYSGFRMVNGTLRFRSQFHGIRNFDSRCKDRSRFCQIEAQPFPESLF